MNYVIKTYSKENEDLKLFNAKEWARLYARELRLPTGV